MMLGPVTGGTGTSGFLRDNVRDLLPGDRFKLLSTSFGLTMLMRCTNKETPAAADGITKLSYLVEQADWDHLYIQPPAPKDPDFTIEAFTIVHQRIVELPGALKHQPLVEVSVLAERPSPGIVGFRTFVSPDDTTYDQIGEQRLFAVRGKIVSENYSGTTPIVDTGVGMVVELYGLDLATIVSQSDQQRDDLTLLVWVGSEIMSVGTVTALGSGKYRVFLRRSCYGTIEAAHAINSECWFVFRAQVNDLAHTSFLPAATVYFKLQAYTATENIEIGALAPVVYVLGAGPFILEGLRLYGQDLGDDVFTGRNPRLIWELYSIAGGAHLATGSADVEFKRFNLRVREPVHGATMWTSDCQDPEHIFSYDENLASFGGPYRQFFFGVQAEAMSGEVTDWEEIEINNVQEVGPGGSAGAGVDRIYFILNPSTDRDHAGIIVWRSLTDPAFTVTAPLTGDVAVVFDGPDTNFSIPQAEGTTAYYRSAVYDAFQQRFVGNVLDITGLFISDVVPYTTLTGTPTLPPPSISPGSQSFSSAFNVTPALPSGNVLRFTLDGTDVGPTSLEWPHTGGVGDTPKVYIALSVNQSCVLNARYYTALGVPSQQVTAVYTLAGGAGTCGSVAIEFSGRQGHSGGLITLRCATSGGTIHYSKNGASYIAYSVPFAIALNDTVEAYDSHSGLVDGPTSFFDNTALGGP
jgi:hypothetical protein